MLLSTVLVHAGPLALLVLTVLISSGCRKSEDASSIDTPDLRWKAALATFAKGEVKKTDQHLEWLTQTDNQYLHPARSWRLVLLSGMARGYAELLDRYMKAAGQPSDPMQLLRHIEILKKVSAKHGHVLGQSYADFERAHPEGEVILSFPIPPFATMTFPAALEQWTTGSAPTGLQAEPLEVAVLQWGITQAICEVSCATGNLEQARQLFATLPVRIPRAVFELGMAAGMFQASSLFGPAQLDDQQRYASLLYQARSAVTKAPSGPETEELTTRIQEALNDKR